jgi:hypothetical protein
MRIACMALLGDSFNQPQTHLRNSTEVQKGSTPLETKTPKNSKQKQQPAIVLSFGSCFYFNFELRLSTFQLLISSFSLFHLP